jgi:predicted DNA-binding transcriptional regulator YafY
MKNSHPPILRMIYIDQKIREDRYPNCKTIAHAFEVNRKTIQRDIDYMRYQLHAPLEFDTVKNGYYYTKPDYFLPALHLEEKEIFALVVATKILKQYKNAPYEKEAQKIFDKITEFIPDTITTDSVESIFSFEQRPTPDINKQNLELLAKATLESRQVDIVYHSLHKNEIRQRLVEPYHLMNHHGNWYLIGYCHLSNDFRTFSVQRILTMTVHEKKFRRRKGFSLEKYQKDNFDLERGEKTYDVKLHFSPYQARWIQERKWHHTQKVQKLESGGLILEMKVRGLNDVKRWVLKYGTEVEVLQPLELRLAIQEEIQKMAKLYGIFDVKDLQDDRENKN